MNDETCDRRVTIGPMVMNPWFSVTFAVTHPLTGREMLLGDPDYTA